MHCILSQVVTFLRVSSFSDSIRETKQPSRKRKWRISSAKKRFAADVARITDEGANSENSMHT